MTSLIDFFIFMKCGIIYTAFKYAGVYYRYTEIQKRMSNTYKGEEMQIEALFVSRKKGLVN